MELLFGIVVYYFVGAGGVGEVEEEVKKEKMVTATKKGAAVLDEHIPDHIKVAYHVLQVVREFIFGYFSLDITHLEYVHFNCNHGSRIPTTYAVCTLDEFRARHNLPLMPNLDNSISFYSN